MDRYVILPGNTDLNRGDQALVWQTIEIAKKAGFSGAYYMLADDPAATKQSQANGIQILAPILSHPGRHSSLKKNVKYTALLILSWGFVALFDLVKSSLLLSRVTRALCFPLLSKSKKQTLKTMAQCDAFFVKGGGFIHSAGKLTDTYVVYFQLFHIMLAHSLGKPVYIMPNSLGPFKGIGIAFMVRKVLKRCKLVTVRESISKKMLQDIGVNAECFADLGFSLAKSESPRHEIEYLRKRYAGYSFVAITARPYRFPNSADPQKKYQDYIENMAQFAQWLYQNDFFPVFVVHTLSTTTHEDDASCIDEIISRLAENEYAVISDTQYTCRDLKAIYAEFDYMVGTRFHSVIFSLAESVPSLAITYGGNKGQGIMTDMGLSEYAIPIDQVSSFELIDKFSLLCKTSIEYNKKMQQYIQRASQEREKLINLLRSFKNHICGRNECNHE